MTILTLAIVWYGCGTSGFIFWWTKDFDFRTSDLPIAILMGIVGPLVWLIGWFIHGGNDRVLFQRWGR